MFFQLALISMFKPIGDLKEIWDGPRATLAHFFKERSCNLIGGTIRSTEEAMQKYVTLNSRRGDYCLTPASTATSFLFYTLPLKYIG